MKFPGLGRVVLSARRSRQHFWEWETTVYPPKEVHVWRPHRTAHGACPAGNLALMKNQDIAQQLFIALNSD